MTLEEKARESSINAMLCTNTIISQSDYEQGYLACAKENADQKDQLEKAKDLIEELYDIISASHSDYCKDVMERARQFLWGGKLC